MHPIEIRIIAAVLLGQFRRTRKPMRDDAHRDAFVSYWGPGRVKAGGGVQGPVARSENRCVRLGIYLHIGRRLVLVLLACAAPLFAGPVRSDSVVLLPSPPRSTRDVERERGTLLLLTSAMIVGGVILRKRRWDRLWKD